MIRLIILIFFLNISQSFAQLIDSNFYEWTVYEIQTSELDPKICYMVSYPDQSLTNHNSRKDPYIMITKFAEDGREEVSVFSGYNYRNNSDVYLTSNDAQFKIYAKENMAWPKTKFEDKKLITNMLKSAFLNVRSNSDIGTYAVDKYSMKGITKAYLRMGEICGD